MINDWNKGIYMATGKPFRGRSLLDNMGLVMSYGNDVSFQDIFVEQPKNILASGESGDWHFRQRQLRERNPCGEVRQRQWRRDARPERI